MTIQENLQITETFVKSWRQNPTRIEPEIISLSNETNRRPDRYFLELSSTGFLVDTETKQSVKIDTQSYLGKKEAFIFAELQEATRTREEGNFVWISPEYPGKYPCTKVIFHQIAYKSSLEKVLLCSAVLCHLSKAEILEIANSLDRKTHTSLEDLRPVLFSPSEEKMIQLWKKLAKFQNKNQNFPSPTEVIYFAQKIIAGGNPHFIAEEMAQRGVLGEHAISCAASSPTTFSELIINRLASSERPDTCRKCGTTVGVACGWCQRCWQIYGS